MNFRKLSMQDVQGWQRFIAPLVVVVLVGSIGTYELVRSYADTISPGASEITSGYSGRCLDDWHDSKTSGNKINLYLCNKSPAQQWLVQADGTIRLDTTHCIGVHATNGKMTIATNPPVGLYNCQGATTSIASAFQLWKANGTQLLNVASGLCLTVPSSDSVVPVKGTQVTLSTCSNANPVNQQWTIGQSTVATGGGTGGGTGTGGGSGTGSGGGSGTGGTGGGTGGGTSGKSLYEPANGQVYIGVSTSSHGTALSTFDAAADINSHPAIFNDYTPADGDMQNQFSNNARMPAGVTPMVSWNLTMQNNAITNGSEDAYITAMANEAKAFGKPVFIRLDWEMNGGWYNNYDQKGGTTPAMFVASWQHAYNLFKSIAPNAAFVWSPNNGEFSDPNGVKTPNDSWYPGDSYVDWIGVDSYPQYDHTPTDVTTKAYGLNWFTSFATTHHKPLMLAEWGMGGQNGTNTAGQPDSSATFDIIFPWAESNPTTVKALVYFDFGGNHALENNPVGAAAYRRYTVGDTRFLYQIVQ